MIAAALYCLGIGFALLTVLVLIACALTMPPPRDPNEYD